MSQERRSKFRPKELAIILSYYDLGTIKEIHSFRRGNVLSPKSLIISERGKFLLKKRPPGHDDPYRVALAHDLQLYLIKKGFCLPHLIGTRHSNSSMLHAYSAVYELFEFVEGEEFNGSPASTASAGMCLKSLHGLLSGYTPAYQVPTRTYHDCAEIRRSIHETVSHTLESNLPPAETIPSKPVSEQLLKAYDQAADTATREGFLADPPVICHGDWHPGNMIFRQEKVFAVLDFDSVHYMPSLGDVANGCLQFSLLARGADPAAWPDNFDADRARAFLDGYFGQPPWSHKQLQIIVSLMIEALISEAVLPIAITGTFANIQGAPFLRMIVRKVTWLQNHALAALTG
jgi:Ser/Thr protein kinase RdoA (MazF antagonist)